MDDGSGIARFIKARLDEDEQVAREAAKWHAPHWRFAVTSELDAHVSADTDIVAACILPGVAPHIARHDPEHALADIAADRALLAAYSADGTGEETPDYYWGLATAIKIRAVRFNGHPDYRPEWKP